MKPGVQRDWKGNLTGARFGFNGLNYLVDAADIDLDTGVCADLVNCDVDYRMNASRRQGFTRKLTAVVTSSWANTTHAYCVIAGQLYVFDGTTATILTNTPTFAGTVEFKQVNNVVLCSDGTQMAIIENTTCTLITSHTDWVDVATIDTWLSTHAPADPAKWNGITSNSNFSVDAFKLKTKAGTCLEFYNGVVYLAINNFVYCTKAFDMEHMDIRYNIVAGFADNVTAIGRVNDGLYVGTESGIYFLEGTGFVTTDKGEPAQSYKQTQLSKFGIVNGSMVRVESKLVPDLKAKDTCLLWTTPLGIFAGGDNGQVVNLSDQQMNVTVGSKASSFFREVGGVYQYLACFNVAASLYTPALNRAATIDTVLVNTITKSHMKYTNFAFNSFFIKGGKLYGSNARGIYLLEGEKDFVGEDIQHDIDAYALTPTTDFETQEKKAVKDAFLHGRFLGDMELSIITEEGEIKDPLPCYYDDNDGLHRKRIKTPHGLRATDWQFKIANIDGSDFTLFDFEVDAKSLGRTV